MQKISSHVMVLATDPNLRMPEFKKAASGFKASVGDTAKGVAGAVAGGLGRLVGYGVQKGVQAPVAAGGLGLQMAGSGAEGALHGFAGTGPTGGYGVKAKMLERAGHENPWIGYIGGRTGALAGAGIGAALGALDDDKEYDENGKVIGRRGLLRRMLGGAAKGVLPGMALGLAGKHFITNPALNNIGLIHEDGTKYKVLGGAWDKIKLEDQANKKVINVPAKTIASTFGLA
jgi:hypothetical protein